MRHSSSYKDLEPSSDEEGVALVRGAGLACGDWPANARSIESKSGPPSVLASGEESEAWKTWSHGNIAAKFISGVFSSNAANARLIDSTVCGSVAIVEMCSRHKSR